MLFRSLCRQHRDQVFDLDLVIVDREVETGKEARLEDGAKRKALTDFVLQRGIAARPDFGRAITRRLADETCRNARSRTVRPALRTGPAIQHVARTVQLTNYQIGSAAVRERVGQ